MTLRSRHVPIAAIPLAVVLFSLLSLTGDAVSQANAGGDEDPEKPASSDAGLVLPRIRSMNDVSPVYPAAEKKANVEGLVLVRVVVKADGTLGEVGVAKAVEGHPAFSTAALTAVRKWSFTPGQRGGKPADVEVMIPVQFKLADKEPAH